MVWPWPLNMWPENHLLGANSCTRFGIDQVKGSKDFEPTTQWAERSGLTLTFEHVTWKSIGIIYLLGANSCTKFGIDQVKGSKDIERTTLRLQTDRPIYRPTDSCKTICRLFQGGHKKTDHIFLIKGVTLIHNYIVLLFFRVHALTYHSKNDGFT